MTNTTDIITNPSLKRRISELTTEDEVWQWVLDPLNAGYVRDVAGRYLTSTLANNNRQHVRNIEINSRVIPVEEEPFVYIEPTPPKEALIELGYPEWDFDEVGKPKKEFLTTIEGKEWRKQAPASVPSLFTRANYEAKKVVKDQERAAASLQIQENLKKAIQDFKDSVIIEWNQELLNSTFVVAGETVTWGEATAEQHAIRAESLTKQASGTLETAALHEKAIDRIRADDAENLNQVEETKV
jgi:malate synthase